MKQSIEEVAYDYATQKTKFRKDVLKEVDADNYVSRHADCMEDFQCGAEWQAKQSPWISVEERLPEESLINPSAWSVTYKVFVLTSNDNASISQRRWNCNTNRWEWAGSGSFKDSIVSWMPIPE